MVSKQHRVLGSEVLVVCQQLEQLERNFTEAATKSVDLDSSRWTDRELLCLLAILNHKQQGHLGERCAGIE